MVTRCHTGRSRTARRTGAGHRRRKGAKPRRYRGAGLGRWLRKAFKTIGKVAKPIFKFMKHHKLLSKGLSLMGDPRAQGAATIARTIGLGKRGGALRLAGAGRHRRRVRRPRYYTRGYGLTP